MIPHSTAPAIGDTVKIVKGANRHGEIGIVVAGTAWTSSVRDPGDRVVRFPDGERLVFDAWFMERVDMYAATITQWSFRVLAQLNELIDFRDLAQDLWDRPKTLSDTVTTAIAAGRYDLAEFLLTTAQADLDRLADLADMVCPEPDEFDYLIDDYAVADRRI